MGGHQSTCSSSDITNIMTNVVQKQNQSCITYGSASNNMNVGGSGNSVNNINQMVGISVDSNCVATSSQNSDFQNSLQSSIAQSLQDKQVAMTGFLNAGSDTVSSNIQNNIKTSITNETQQSCVNQLNEQNILSISGNDNVVNNVNQTATGNLIAQCMNSQGQVAQAINNISDTTNQHSAYTATNPFDFITDAIEAVFGSMAVFFIFLIVCVVAFVALMVIRHKRKNKLTSANAK